MTTKAESSRAKRGPYAKSADRRLAIVRAAHAVFAAQGYVGGSLQDVADRVGMSQTSLLHYFRSKRELLLAVLNWRDSITGDGQTPPDPDESFSDSVLRQARFNEQVPGVIELYAVLCAESLTDDHPGREYFAARFATLRGTYVDEFRRLAEGGRLREGVDPALAAASLIALWDGIQTQWLLDPDSVDMAACLRGYLSLVILDPPEASAET
jgi:AcrR family transcriptional regulator